MVTTPLDDDLGEAYVEDGSRAYGVGSFEGNPGALKEECLFLFLFKYKFGFFFPLSKLFSSRLGVYFFFIPVGPYNRQDDVHGADDEAEETR
jgi:hypothetical protein